MELLLFVGGLIMLRWLIPRKYSNTHGSARFAERRDIRKAGGLRKGFFVGKHGWRTVRYPGPHAITIGPTGAHKGTSVVVPNVLEQPFVFLIDPGGENTAIASKTLRKRSSFRCINPIGLYQDKPAALPRHGFNPLAMLDAHADQCASDAKLLAEMIIARTGQESNASGYFKDSATVFVQALLIHVATAEPGQSRNLGTAYEHMHGGPQEWEALLSAMKANPACGGLVRHAATRMERTEAQASEEFSAIMSTIQQDLSWLADPRIRETLSRNDVDFCALKGGKGLRKGAVISYVIPQYMTFALAGLTRLALGCAMLTLSKPPLARSRVLIMIDEAASLGTVRALPDLLATTRKLGISIWTIWQAQSQIDQLYGAHAQTILSNCDLRQFLAFNDAHTAEQTSKLLGVQTVQTVSRDKNGDPSFGETGRALRSLDELIAELKEFEQIVFISRMRPLLLKLLPYFRNGRLRGRYNRKDGQTQVAGPRKLFWAAVIVLLITALAHGG